MTYPADVTPYGQYLLEEQIEPSIYYTAPDGGPTFYLNGGYAPFPGVQDGMILQAISGVSPPFKHLMSQGAHQDGATWNDAVYDPMEIDMTLQASATDAAGLSAVVSDWISAWDPRKPGRLTWESAEAGTWWADVRLFKAWPDQMVRSARRWRKQTFTHSCVATDPFWKSTMSVAQSSGGALHLTNIGDQPAWPQYLVKANSDETTFAIGNGPDSGSMIEFGPLRAGQTVLLTTLPRLRTVVDLTVSGGGNQTELQEFIDMLIKIVTFDQVPPLLIWFESLFGIRPPQGVLYSLLKGRFSEPIPGVAQPANAEPASIAVSISGSGSITGSVIPLRRWPESSGDKSS